MKLTDEEVKRLEQAANEAEWDAACDAVKDARDGQYPPDWWERVQLSGLMARVVAGWGKAT